MYSKERLSLALGVLGATFVLGNSPVVAASLSFTPAGTNGMIVRSGPGAVSFTIMYDTKDPRDVLGNLIQPLPGAKLNLKFDIEWDSSELKYGNFTNLVPEESNIKNNTNNSVSLDYKGLALSLDKLNLATVNFNVIGFDPNDGVSDFSIVLHEAIIAPVRNDPRGNGGNVHLPGNRDVNVVQPLPEPLTILGSGLALGLGILFKKQRSKRNVS